MNTLNEVSKVSVDVSKLQLKTHTQCGVKGLALILESRSIVEVMGQLRSSETSPVFSKTFCKLEDALSINQPTQQKMFTCNTNRISRLIPIDDQGQKQYSITFNKDAVHLLSSGENCPQLNLSWLTSEPVNEKTIGVFFPPNIPIEAGRFDLFQEKTIELLNLIVATYLVDINYVVTGTLQIIKHQELTKNQNLFPSIEWGN